MSHSHVYPLANIQKTMENHYVYLMGKSTISTAIFVYQRVITIPGSCQCQARSSSQTSSELMGQNTEKHRPEEI